MNWEPFEADEGVRCPGGPVSHEWRMTIDEGAVSLTSGCADCDSTIDPTGDFLYLPGSIVGRLEFEPDHPDLGGWHGMERCDCGWRFKFVFDRMEHQGA